MTLLGKPRVMHLENSGEGGSASSTGHVRVLTLRDDSSSRVLVGIDLDGETANDLSGYSVSLSAMVRVLLWVPLGITAKVELTAVMFVFMITLLSA